MGNTRNSEALIKLLEVYLYHLKLCTICVRNISQELILSAVFFRVFLVILLIGFANMSA